jgi:hypothetical protein
VVFRERLVDADNVRRCPLRFESCAAEFHNLYDITQIVLQEFRDRLIEI